MPASAAAPEEVKGSKGYEIDNEAVVLVAMFCL